MTTVPMTKARTTWHELIRCVEAGEEIILTRRGRPVARLVKVSPKPERDWDEIRRRVKQIQRSVKAKMQPDLPDAAHSQDFLYDENGLPA